MSWFDASGLASIAKSALKGAQRTIDKALDIKEQHEAGRVTSVDSSEAAVGDESGRGVSVEARSSEEKEDKGAGALAMWGSFAGSFFEIEKAPPIDSLDDSFDVANKHFSGSKLVVQSSCDGEGGGFVDDMEYDRDGSGRRTDEIGEREGSEWNTPTREFEDVNLSQSKSTDSELSSSVSTCGSAIMIKPLTDSELMEMRLSIEEQSTTPERPAASLTTAAAATTTVTTTTTTKPRNGPELPAASDTKSSSTSSNVIIVAPTPRAEILLSPPPPTPPPSKPLIDTQPQSSRQDLTSILQITNIIDIPQDGDDGGGGIGNSSAESLTMTESNDETSSSQSDRTIVARDRLLDSSSDTSLTEMGMVAGGSSGAGGGSSLKVLLADAMSEKSGGAQQEVMDVVVKSKEVTTEEFPPHQSQDTHPGQSSPVSSESRSDLVKIGSDHTSGDELETTTSSDIEIISSPNGDSSSTQSRQSPARCQGGPGGGGPGGSGANKTGGKQEDSKMETLCKMAMKKSKGHTRELSETSSISDDSHPTEMDRLIRRLSEMSSILESREAKLADVTRRNAELEEVNSNLREQLDLMFNKQLASVDLSKVNEEYTQRLSSLEKKFQQMIRENDTLKKQLEQNRQELAMRMSRSELESLTSEKDETIKELREEGEKLSKQQLQQSNIIKKLRAKEKENDGTIKNLKETIEDLSSETERLKRSLAAKGEVEKSQIEAIHLLTSKNAKLETEVAQLRSTHDDLTQSYDTAKSSLDAAKKELADQTRSSSELKAQGQLMELLENEKRTVESQSAAVLSELEDLRQKLNNVDASNAKREQQLRRENQELLGRLEAAEARNEELSQSMVEVNKPLMRQLESLQAAHTMKISSFEKVERELSLKINELQSKLQASVTSERKVRDEYSVTRSKLADIESNVDASSHEKQMLRMQLEQLRTEKQLVEQAKEREIHELKEQLRTEREAAKELSRNAAAIQDQLETERAVSEAERKKSVTKQPSSSHSPTFDDDTLANLDKRSVASDSFWGQDEQLEVGPIPRYTNMFEIQLLQTSLKQREGEVQQLQWELNRRENERILLSIEMSVLINKVEELESKLARHDNTEAQLEELRQKHDALCQLYGEKVEEHEELKLDLQDVKEMYKNQIDELLKKQYTTS